MHDGDLGGHWHKWMSWVSWRGAAVSECKLELMHRTPVSAVN
jgi:hypothetical protein